MTLRLLTLLCAAALCVYGLGAHSLLAVGAGSVVYAVVGRQVWLPYALCCIAYAWLATAADAWVCVAAACVLVLLTLFREQVAFA